MLRLERLQQEPPTGATRTDNTSGTDQQRERLLDRAIPRREELGVEVEEGDDVGLANAVQDRLRAHVHVGRREGVAGLPGERRHRTPCGRLERRAQQVLGEPEAVLAEIERSGLPAAIERGTFADISRTLTGGKGLDGVVEKASDYFNPFAERMLPRPAEETP